MFDLFDRDPDRPSTRNLKRIDRFVRDYRREFAALVWGYDRAIEAQNAQNGDREYLGIDLQPAPHFITCTRAQIEALNAKVDNRLREAIGVLEGYDPNKEVLVVGIADGQVQIIVFLCEDPTPEQEFQALGVGVEDLLDRLEACMTEELVDLSTS
ncbi:MAG: hypothetical protein HC795_16395 [Coleofasciculaceae cyanobacterium RL_1_1]|nr:hypothetical protein [Coleofasciculaceae cyanobacterium RL_1_1]